MKIGLARLALVAAVLCSLAPISAHAVVVHPAPNPIVSSSPPGNFTWSTNPGPFAGSWFSNHANTPSGDIGAENPSNVEQKLESVQWLGVPLTFVSGGSCGGPGVVCTPSNKGGTWTGSGTDATVFGVHFGDNFLAFLFSAPVHVFSISGLPNGVSNIYAFNLTATPLPAALWLMVSALAGWLGLTRWARKGI
jgi:hypothetical protein